MIRYKDVFDNMLGYIDGRVYYNIANWYNFLKILPGYKYNKEFFEAMLVPKKNIKSEKEKKFKTPFFINFFILVKLFFKLFFYKNDHQEFIKKFKNCSPKQLLQNQRICSAKDLLQYSETDITEISALCGFNNSSSFSKIFKQVVGKTPTNFRRDCLQKRYQEFKK